MASIVDELGLQLEPMGDLVLTKEQISRTVDLMIVRFHTAGVNFRDIAAIMNRSKSAVADRYNSIPQEVRDHYGPLQLG